ILVKKPVARPRIYAYSIDAETHHGMLKIGQTAGLTKKRVEQQLKTAAITNYRIEIDEPSERHDGSIITDFEVRQRLKEKGFANPILEWMCCTAEDVLIAIQELRQKRPVSGTQHLTFPMRDEQRAAVEKTYDYFQSIWAEDPTRVPEFLWNAKMRFGKTFTTYQLAKKLKSTRVLVLTFKPAVEDAWKSDLRSHVDFEGWQYLSGRTG